MTLREYGQSIAAWWDAYLIEITTKSVLDWSIGHIVLTAIPALLVLVLVAGLAEWRLIGFPKLGNGLDCNTPWYA